MTVSSPTERSPHRAPSPAGSARIDRRSVVAAVLGSTVTVEVDAHRDGWVARIDELLGPFLLAPTAPPVPTPPAISLAVSADGDLAVLRAGTTELARAPWPVVEARLLVEVNAVAIAGCAGLAVHAGVVAHEDRAICFPGESGRGKSTMTAACLGVGFDYVSDEALCLERPGGAVVPYPRPLALSPTSVELLGLASRIGPTPDAADRRGDDPGAVLDARPGADPGDREVVVTAASLGARAVAPDRRLRLAHVVELHRGARELHLEPVHRSQAVRHLLAMAFNHFKEPDASVALIAGLARDVQVWRLHLDDPVEAAALLARRLA